MDTARGLKKTSPRCKVLLMWKTLQAEKEYVGELANAAADLAGRWI